MISAKLQNTTDVDEPEDLWMNIKSSILEAAEDTCGKQVPTKRRHWMTTDILDKMEERRLCKNDTTETGQKNTDSSDKKSRGYVEEQKMNSQTINAVK